MQDTLNDVATPEMIEDCYGLRVQQLNRLLTRHFEHRLAPFDLTLAQFSTLVWIAGDSDNIRAADICAARDVEKSTLSRNLARLQKSGLITISEPVGRSGRLLGITDAGRELVRRVTPVWQKASREATFHLCRVLPYLPGAIETARKLAKKK